MTALTLYELSAEYRVAAEKLAELDMDETTVNDTLESIVAPLEEKAQNVIKFARDFESTAAAIKDAEHDMAMRRKAIEKRAEWLRRYVKDAMQVAGIKKIECPWFRISIQNNPPSVEIFEPAFVPVEFMRQPEPPPPAPDKKAIAERIKAGEEIPGCRLTQSHRLVVS
jgi:hypothetical protein